MFVNANMVCNPCLRMMYGAYYIIEYTYEVFK